LNNKQGRARLIVVGQGQFMPARRTQLGTVVSNAITFDKFCLQTVHDAEVTRSESVAALIMVLLCTGNRQDGGSRFW
jgi:hypothetical protein